MKCTLSHQLGNNNCLHCSSLSLFFNAKFQYNLQVIIDATEAETVGYCYQYTVIRGPVMKMLHLAEPIRSNIKLRLYVSAVEIR